MKMNHPIPKCLLTVIDSGRYLDFTVTDGNGQKILFAFSTLGRGKDFCRRIVEHGHDENWFVYNIENEQNGPGPMSNTDEKTLVAIDATDLANGSYQVVAITKLIKAITNKKTEIECEEYHPIKTRNI